MMKRTFLMKTLLLMCLALPSTLKAQFKIVGYLWAKPDMIQNLQKLDLKQITHLNLAFINPNPEGNFKDLPALDTVMQIAKKHNIKVMMSCGGGSSHAYYANLLKDEQRPQLVKNFIAFLDQYKLDGIDVDLEGNDIDANYEAFVVELRKPLSQRKKLLSAAVAWWTRARMTDLTLAQFDFINIMAYDKTGPWRPENPGQHSPMAYATDHLNYWKNERGLAKEKLNLGLPFYAYGFGTLPTSDKTYSSMGWKDIVQRYPNALDVDEIAFPAQGGNLYYNGKATIKAKTELAKQEAGGVMIWQLMHDTLDDNSLLKLITLTAGKK